MPRWPRCWGISHDPHPVLIIAGKDRQVVDGIFCVSEFIRGTDPFERDVREYHYGGLKKRHPKAVMSVWHTLDCIQTREQKLEYLSRQIPPVPVDVNIVLDFFGTMETVQAARNGKAATLTLAWRSARDALLYDEPDPDPSNVRNRRLQRRRFSTRRR